MPRTQTGESIFSRAVRIVEAFGPGDVALPVTEIARRTGLNIATTSRLIKELVGVGWLNSDERGRVRIGLRMWELASRAAPALGLKEAADDADQRPDAGFAHYLAALEEPEVPAGQVGPDVPTRTVVADGGHGPVTIRIYGEAATPAGPALVWLHGGSFVGGGLDMPESDYVARVLAASGTRVLSVDYRLARDGVHFPVPHEDTLSAWFWARTNAAGLGIDPELLCLGGAGAGGNLAVGAALYLTDTGRPLPAKLLLAYPFLHVELPPPTEGRDENVMAGLPRHLRFTFQDCLRIAENYIGGPVSMASSYAMPGYADPSGLPPTAIVASEYSDLRGSSELFAANLKRAGIEVSFYLARGALHGHLNHAAGSPEAGLTLEFLARELTTATAP